MRDLPEDATREGNKLFMDPEATYVLARERDHLEARCEQLREALERAAECAESPSVDAEAGLDDNQAVIEVIVYQTSREDVEAALLFVQECLDKSFPSFGTAVAARFARGGVSS